MKTDFVDNEVSQDERLEYRAISIGAIVGVILGVLSCLTLLAAQTSIEACLLLSPLPLAGLVVSLRSFLKIRQSPQEFTGLKLAVVGGVLSTVFLTGGIALATFIYSTEVPSGYERISFSEMNPEKDPNHSYEIIPPEIMAFQGKKVFIKGYMRPPTQRYQVDNFLLVRDNNECCFGDLSKVRYFDQMVVQLARGMRADYSTRVFRLGGILKIEPQNARPGSNLPVYSLAADYLK